MAKFLSAVFCLLVVGATCKTAEPTVNVVRIPPTPTHRPAKPAVKVDRKVLVKKLNGINGDILKIVDKKLLSGSNISHEEKHRILADLNKKLLAKEVAALTVPAGKNFNNNNNLLSDNLTLSDNVEVNSLDTNELVGVIVPLAVKVLEPLLIRIIDRIFDPDFYVEIYTFFKNLFKKSTREEGWTFWKGFKRIFVGRSAEDKAKAQQAKVNEVVSDIKALANKDKGTKVEDGIGGLAKKDDGSVLIKKIDVSDKGKGTKVEDGIGGLANMGKEEAVLLPLRTPKGEASKPKESKDSDDIFFRSLDRV